METLVKERFGTFSSSNIWKLLTNNRKGDGFGAPALKYIKQVGYEIKLGRAINVDRDSRPTSWGKFVERYVFEKLDTSYLLVSDERIFHSTINYWSGAADLLKSDSVCDVKCPFNLEVFCDKINALNASIDLYKEEFPEDYWQHVSNAILNNKDYAEAIIYCPYQSELQEIRDMVSNYDGDQNKVAWINWSEDSDLPYIPDGGFYKNLHIIRFEVPETEKQLLTEKVLAASALLKK